ncbi:MAG TPA: T9SS type A sorting domain-containing protein [Bacteroidia bacterium]|nr:T9SS type A sorting domain-containing protein [Bacteroidia bacterium]
MKKLYLALLILLTINFTTKSQWVANPSLNTIVSDDITFSETIPISAPGLNGSTYISWFQGNSSGSYNAMLQLLDINGVPVWSSPLIVSNHPQQSALYNSDFASDNAGNAIMAFQDIRNGDLQTVIYKISPTGAFLWGNDGIQLHDALANFEAAPRIAVFSNDDVVVGWSASDGSNKWVAYQKFDAAGTPLFSVPQTIDSTNVNYSRVIPIVSGNKFILVYVQETGSFPSLTSAIFCRQYDQNGVTSWSNPVQVSSYTIGFVSIPLVVADNTGGCYIGFNSGTPGAPAVNDAFVQYINDIGTTVFGVNGVELSSMNGNHKFIKDMYYNPSDSKLYCTLKITDSGQNGAGVYAQGLNNLGVIQFTSDGLAVVPISTSSPCEPFSIEEAGNGLYITYTEGGFNNQALKAHKISYVGSLIYNNPVVLSDASSGKSRVTTCVSNAGSQLVASWEDTRINQGTYAQNMNNDGTLGVITKISEFRADNFDRIFYTSLINEHFAVKANTNAYLTIFSNTGQIIYSQNIIEGIQTIDCSSFSNGLYLFEIKTESNSLKGKFIQLKQ